MGTKAGAAGELRTTTGALNRTGVVKFRFRFTARPGAEVTLRVSVRDAAGGSVSATILRAWDTARAPAPDPRRNRRLLDFAPQTRKLPDCAFGHVYLWPNAQSSPARRPVAEFTIAD
jgi:hypothetical protein